jgi:hypothetical protein
MTDNESWRCPLCRAVAADPAEHLRAAHGVGGNQDRFGLRDAARHGTGRPPTPGSDGASSDGAGAPALGRGRLRPRPGPRRSIRPRRAPASIEPDLPPARPAPLPADAAVLRLVCESLEGVDVAQLQQRLADLPGIEAVTIDLYARTADLFFDRNRAAPPHLVTLAMERIGLAVTGAELHRAPTPGHKLDDSTLLLVVL